MLKSFITEALEKGMNDEKRATKMLDLADGVDQEPCLGNEGRDLLRKIGESYETDQIVGEFQKIVATKSVGRNASESF
jgi:hypothetical protein